jgi:hypothetical protein
VTKTLELPALLTAESINVETMDNWDLPHRRNDKPYVWRTGDPEASMWHHTATPSYTPNRAKANMYAGLIHAGGQRLYQSGGGVPTIVIANAYPGPITSGYGKRGVLQVARADIRNDSLAVGPDDDPRWAGNKSYWNTEIVLDGVGTWIDDEVWDMLIVAARVLHELMGWSEWRAIGHAQHTRRKPDPNDGEYPSAKETMMAFRSDLGVLLEEDDDMAVTQNEFVGALRYTDIDKMAADKIITKNEAKYFKTGQPWPGEVEDNQFKVLEHPDWTNLYVSWKVRAPIWAV